MIRPSIRMNGYRSWILSEATGGPDDIDHGGVFARHTDSEGSCSPDKNGSGNSKIRHKHFTRADDANTRYTMYSNALWGRYYLFIYLFIFSVMLATLRLWRMLQN
jgi:hypothetical protein